MLRRPVKARGIGPGEADTAESFVLAVGAVMRAVKLVVRTTCAWRALCLSSLLCLSVLVPSTDIRARVSAAEAERRGALSCSALPARERDRECEVVAVLLPGREGNPLLPVCMDTPDEAVTGTPLTRVGCRRRAGPVPAGAGVYSSSECGLAPRLRRTSGPATALCSAACLLAVVSKTMALKG
jgi:hypothetical protein